MASIYQVNTTLSNGAVIDSGTILIPDTTIPVANSTTLGGVMPVTKTDDMTQEVGVDSTGKLYTAPGGGGGDYIPLANITNNNSVVLGTNISSTTNNYTVSIGSNITGVGLYGIAISPTQYGQTNLGMQCIGIGHFTRANGSYSIALGGTSSANNRGIAIGSGADADINCIAIGVDANTSGYRNSILLSTTGKVSVASSNTFQVENYPMLDLTTGNIYQERISQYIPTFTDNGDGTMTITANGSTFKVAIVTE